MDTLGLRRCLVGFRVCGESGQDITDTWSMHHLLVAERVLAPHEATRAASERLAMAALALHVTWFYTPRMCGPLGGSHIS